MGLFDKLFCKHFYNIEKWHFTHGSLGNQIRYIEGNEICQVCGKRRYFFVEPQSFEEKEFLKKYLDRQER